MLIRDPFIHWSFQMVQFRSNVILDLFRMFVPASNSKFHCDYSIKQLFLQ